MVYNILSAPEINMEMNRLASSHIALCDGISLKIREAGLKYANTDDLTEREAIRMELMHGNDDISALLDMDTSLIPDVIKRTGDLSLREAAHIIVAMYGGHVNDIAELLSNMIAEESLYITDAENLSVDNVYITGGDTMKVRHLFDIRQFMALPEVLRSYLEVGDFDKAIDVVCKIYRYRQLFNYRRS